MSIPDMKRKLKKNLESSYLNSAKLKARKVKKARSKKKVFKKIIKKESKEDLSLLLMIKHMPKFWVHHNHNIVVQEEQKSS